MEFKKSKWNLKDLMVLEEYKELVKEVEKYTVLIEHSKKDLKHISNKKFLQIIKYSEKLSSLIARIGGYVSLWFSEDVNSPKAKAFMAEVEQLAVKVDNRTLFFNIWFKELDDKNANELINGAPKEYRYHLKLARATRKYMLSEKEERIINIKDITGIGALDKVYDILTNKLVFNLKIKNKVLKLNREQLTEYFRDNNGELRKNSYNELLNVYSNQKEVLTEIYRSNVLDTKNEDMELRGYKSPITIRNISNDIDDRCVEVLLDVCKDNVDVFQKYFKLKGKILGLNNMSRYDIYAPIKEKKLKVNYNEGTKLVFGAYDKFSPLLGKLARNIFVKKHIDSEIRQYKRGGAFCSSSTPDILPYVLVNYNDTLESAHTLAHELGHAIHTQLASGNNIFNFHSTLPLAETASIFGESLFYDHIKNMNKFKNLNKSFAIKQLDNFYATINRQAYFVMFEKKAHELIMQGKTSEDLSKEYLRNLKEQFGNSLKVPDNFKDEWIAIPHIFHSPFYCYAYSFGNLLVMSLYDRYKKEGDKFLNDYLKILSAGSSDSPKNILSKAGIDIHSRSFWQSGFNSIKGLVKDLQ